MADPALPSPLEAPAPTGKASFPWRTARDLVRPAVRPRVLVVYVLLGLLAGLLEAMVIVIVVATASALSTGGEAVTLEAAGVSIDVTAGEAVAAGLVAVALLMACGLPSAWLSARVAARLLTRLRSTLLHSLLRASWEQQSVVVEAQLQDLAAVHGLRVSNLVLILARLIEALLGLVAFIVAAFVVDAPTAVAMVGVVLVLAALFRPLIRTVRDRSARHLAAHQDYVAELSDAFGVLPEVRVFGVSEAAAAAVDRTSAETSAAYRTMMFRGLVVPVLYLSATLAVLLGGLGLASGQESLDLARVGAIALFLLRGLRYSQQVQSSWQAAVEQGPYVEGIREALDRWSPGAAAYGTRHLDAGGELSLRDVAYTYPGGEVGIEGVTLRLGHGEVVGLQGPSGAGKSTLAQIVLGLRRPTRGEYTIDGIPAAELDEASWHRLFSYVPQSPVLIKGSVRDNVRFHRPEVTAAAVDEALRAAGLSDDLAAWPEGADRQVGHRGTQVSGGQRQRIAIARALAGSPSVLVMDEPTSALDAQAEETVRSAIEALRGRITVLLIAHRPSTLEACDRVLTLDRHQVEGDEERP